MELTWMRIAAALADQLLMLAQFFRKPATLPVWSYIGL